MPKIPAKVEKRISAGLRKYQKIFTAAKDRDINESDTVVIIADFLSEVLGFEKYSEITTEFSVRGTYCDLATKIGGQVQYLVEAKAIGVSLKDSHIRQATSYAAQEGIEWVILTNGADWQSYRMRFEQPIDQDLVFQANMIETTVRRDAVEQFYLLSREGMAKSAIEEFRRQKDSCSPFLVAQTILSDAILSTVRRELRRVSPGAKDQ